MTRILLMVDYVEGLELLRSALAPYGYGLTTAETIALGLAEVRRRKTDLIILDISSPTVDRYGVLKTLREIDADTPILMVSANVDGDDKVQALRLGADDYLSKPIDVNELLARVRATFRRSTPRVTRRFGKVEVNLLSLQVWRDGIPVPLRPREFDLLLALMDEEGRVVSRKELLKGVWGYRRDVNTRTVDNHISRLRFKLEDNPAHPKHVITVPKRGYRFQS